jgi:hypothetical protein
MGDCVVNGLMEIFMEDTYTIPEPIVEPVETTPMPEVAIAPETAVETPQEAVQSEEAPVVPIAECESCGARAELFDVPHHQPGNATMWHYCVRCKAVHEVVC